VLQSKRDGLILCSAIVLSNLRALSFFPRFPDPSRLFGSAWLELALWFGTTLVVTHSLTRENLLPEYRSLCRRNWALGVFIALAFVSAWWSVDGAATSFRAVELLLATVVAAYIGTRYRPDQLLEILFWAGAIVLVLCLGLVFGLPTEGQMHSRPDYRSWRGVYWHKNHLGSIAALVNVVALWRMLIAREQRRADWLGGVFYLLSLATVYFAYSATGGIVLIALHLFALCVWLWIRTSHRWRAWHYSVALGVAVAGLAGAAASVDRIFGIFNRSPTMSGRVDLWNYLLKDVVPQRLWWGHGFGAIWTIESFRVGAGERVHWGKPAVIADNGFLDVLLHLGIVGLLIFLGVLIVAAARSLRYGLARGTLTDFFPLLLMFYAVVGNVAFSLFMETEVFVWLLIVIVLFETTPRSDPAEVVPRHATNHPVGLCEERL
jgi:exopolysaccharide production protein ExoQ